LYKRFDINKWRQVSFHYQFKEKTVVPNPSDILNLKK